MRAILGKINVCKLLVKITSTLNMNKDLKALYRQSNFSSTARYEFSSFQTEKCSQNLSNYAAAHVAYQIRA